MTNSSPTAVPREGDIIAGKYRVERVLGVGGMGVVVAAHHLALDERVALKFLLPTAVARPETIERFVREARAAAKIKNEHVARVADVGQLENGSPYMVMEYLEGGDLAEWLAQRGSLPYSQAVDFVLQACEALAEAHTLGIVHRDLKPANLFCIQRTDGQFAIKVLDFGISKVTTPGAAGHQMTKTSALMGSPLYMSPEQMKSSKAVDARTDIWSLGAILYELMTGRPVFDAETVTELAIVVATEPAARLRSRLPDAPEGLERVLARCLERDRDARYQTVGELALELQEFAPPHARLSVDRVLGTLRRAGGETPAPDVRATGRSAPSFGAIPVAAQTDVSWGQTAPGTSRSGKLVAGVAAICSLGAIVLASYVVLHRRPPPDTTEATAPPVASVAPTPSSAAPPPSASAEPPVAVAPSPDKPAEAVKPAASATATPRAPRGAVTPATQAASIPKPKANCDPPYYFDAKGTRVFKKECPL